MEAEAAGAKEEALQAEAKEAAPTPDDMDRALGQALEGRHTHTG